MTTAVAELAMCLVLALNRKVHRAYNRVREANFSLEGLVGFDLHGKTFGIIGTGRIGRALARIAHGFGCRVLAVDGWPNEQLQRELGVEYVDLAALYRESDMISLHVPLTTQLYFKDDPFIAKDPWASRKPSMAIGLKQNGRFLQGAFDIVLARGF